MQVTDVMTKSVKMCRATGVVGEAAQLMLDQECGCLPVVDGRGRLVGMLTDRDICLAVAALRHRTPWEIPVRDVMSPSVVSCLETDHIEAVLVAMKEHGVRRVPIVDRERRVKGLVSIDDCICYSGPQRGQLPTEAVMDVLRHLCAAAHVHDVAGTR